MAALRIVVVIPALDEEEGVAAVVREVPPLVDEVIVVDNGSRDRTAAAARDAGATVVSEPRRGYGSACLAGIAAAGGADVIVFLDADRSDYPAQLVDVVRPILDGRADLVIGSRTLGRSEAGSHPWHAVLGTRACVALMNLLAGSRATDLGPFRAITADALRRLDMRDRTYGWTVEMQVQAARRGLRVVEVPVDYRRRLGRSKVSGTLRGTVGAGTKIVATILRYATPRGWVVALAGLVLTGCVTAWALGPLPTTRIGPHLGLFGLAFAAYLVALAASRGLSRRGLLVCLGAALAWRAALVTAPPLLSEDVNRYVWEGRIQLHGGNPYAWGDRPESPRWQPLRDEVWAGVGHKGYTAVYPPLFLLASRAVVALYDFVSAMKAFLVACELATLGALALVLKRRRQPLERLLVLAWSPLALLEIAGSGHNDAFGMLWMVLALLALEVDRPLLSALAASAGFMSKLLPGLVAAAWARRYRPWHVLAGAVLAAALVLAYLDPEAKKTMLLSLSKYARFWRFNETLFAPLAALLGSHTAAVRAGSLLTLGLALALAWRRAEPVASATAVVAAFLLLTPNVLPWYALWLLPLLVLRDEPAVLLFTGTVSLAYLVYPGFQSGEPWKIGWGWRLLEYGPCALVWAWERLERRRLGVDSAATTGRSAMMHHAGTFVLVAGLAAFGLAACGRPAPPQGSRAAAEQPGAATAQAPRPAVAPDTILYGAAYYHEYMPYERLDKDVELMKRAGFTVVRVGESTWTSWEPREGEFHYDWMDRIVGKMQEAGIRVVMGTPTYSIPPWLYAKHPEIMVVPLGQVRTTREFYGIRQNFDISHPVYRQYCERIIRRIAQHYGKHPGVVGWQIDNETGAYGTAGPNVQAGFKEWLKRKFGTVDAMNKAWGLVYWGQLLNSWNELPPRDGIINPGWKLEWERYQRWLVTDFLRWQAGLVRQYAEPRQWVTQDFHGGTRYAVDSQEISKFLDVAAINPYHDTQERLDGWWIAFSGDFTRSMKRAPYLVTETNAQTTGWDAKSQYPPFDGQLRLQAWANVASGAHMVEYWHWHSLHYGQETYWKGLLGHDLEPNRVYEEATRIGAEFKRLGPQLAGMMPKNRVAVLHSVDSHWGLQFMPIGDTGRDERGREKANYAGVEDQLHRALYDLNVGADFVFAEEPDFTGYDVLVVPPLYVASDALLEKIAAFAKAGGHVLLTFKSGFTNEWDTVRWTRAPGPLREAAGVSYQEFSSLKEPLPLKGDPFGVGPENRASAWVDMLLVETAKPLASYDHPFFGRYPALTRNAYGKGTVTYQGTVLTDALERKVVADVLKQAGIVPEPGLPAKVRLRESVGRDGKPLHFYLNFSDQPQSLAYAHGPGTELLSEKPVAPGGRLTLGPWDLAVIRE